MRVSLTSYLHASKLLRQGCCYITTYPTPCTAGRKSSARYKSTPWLPFRLRGALSKLPFGRPQFFRATCAPGGGGGFLTLSLDPAGLPQFFRLLPSSPAALGLSLEPLGLPLPPDLGDPPLLGSSAAAWDLFLVPFDCPLGRFVAGPAFSSPGVCGLALFLLPCGRPRFLLAAAGWLRTCAPSLLVGLHTVGDLSMA